MDNKNNSGMFVGILIGIIIMLLVFIGLFVTGIISFKSNTISDNDKASENNQIDNNTSREEQSGDNNLDITGIYNIESKNEYSYYKSTVNITNNNDSSIDFIISTVHGMNEENVNVGEVKGVAKKIGDNEYVVEETRDGNTSKISFVFSNKDLSQYLTIDESYSNDINPYGGHGVYFASIYEKEK